MGHLHVPLAVLHYIGSLAVLQTKSYCPALLALVEKLVPLEVDVEVVEVAFWEALTMVSPLERLKMLPLPSLLLQPARLVLTLPWLQQAHRRCGMHHV